MNTTSGAHSATLTDRLLERQVAFIAVFFIVFLASYFFLVMIDFVPEPISEETKEEFEKTPYNEVHQAAGVAAAVQTAPEPQLPVQIYIEKLDRTIEVLNPVSRDVAVLDNALLEGVVRHPDSAKLGQEGNVFILGHSSYLPNVFNKNFQAFNGIQELEWGDTIEVTSDNAVFVYRIEKVYRADAEELIVPIAGDEHKLTLATCDSFGSVQDRFIVEATQVEVREF